MNGKILVYIQHHNGKINPVSIELIGEAQRMSMGKNYEIYGGSVGEENQVFLQSLKNFYTNIESIQNAVLKVVEDIEPEIFLIGATKEGRAIAPGIAVRLKTGLTADCIELHLLDGGELLQIRPAFDDKVLAHIVTKLGYKLQQCVLEL